MMVVEIHFVLLVHVIFEMYDPNEQIVHDLYEHNTPINLLSIFHPVHSCNIVTNIKNLFFIKMMSADFILDFLIKHL